MGDPVRKPPLSQLPLSVLEGGLAQKLRLHIFNFDFSREVLHESFLFHIFLEEALPSHLSGGGLARKLVCCHFFKEVSVFTTSTFSLGGWPCAKASLYIFRPQFFEGVFARKLPFHNFKFQVWRDVWHESSVFNSSAYSFGEKRPRKAIRKLNLREVGNKFPWLFSFLSLDRNPHMSVCRFFPDFCNKISARWLAVVIITMLRFASRAMKRD